MFLSDEEVESLTRRKRPRAQIEVLRQRRIPFELDGDGRPVVMECLLKEHIMGVDSKAPTKTTEPDFSHVA